MTTPINVGFVGLSANGWAATTLGPSLLQPSLQNRYKLVAVSTTSEQPSKASAEKHAALTGHSIKAYHGDTSRIAADPEVDLVVISVRGPHQRDAVLPVIENKKNFFLEWPVGKGAETYEIAEAVHKHGVKSFIGLQGRCSPVIRKVKAIIESGAIGAVRSSTMIALAPRANFFPPFVSEEFAPLTINKAMGNTALRVAIGPMLDPFIFALSEFRTINATAVTAYPTAEIVDANGKPTGQTIPAIVPDHYTISGQLKSGAIATIIWRIGYKSTSGRTHLLWEIDGEEGSIRIESSESAYLNISNPNVSLNGERIEIEGTESGTLGILEYAWKAYANGDKDEYANIDDAVRVHRILDKVEQSLEEGKTVVL